MKIGKIALTVSLAGAAVLSLSACSSSNSSGSTGSSDKKVTLSIFNIKTETSKQMQSLIKDYENTHKNVTINLTTVGGGQDAGAALKAKFASGDQPDIFMLGGLSDAKTYQRYLADQTNTSLIKKALPGTVEGATLGGKVLGAPVLIEGHGWMINKSIFEKAGIDPSSIKSFADFKSAVETLDSKKTDLGLKGVFAYSGDQADTWVTSQASGDFVAGDFNNSLSKVFDAKTYQMSDIASQSMKNYYDLVIKYNAEPFQSVSYATSVQELFATGKAAIIYQGNWIVPTLNDMDPNFAKNDLEVLPTFDNGSNSGKFVDGPSWYWGVNKTKGSSSEKASEDFLNWMYTDKSSMDKIINDFKYIPAYSNFNASQISDPVSKTLFQALNNKKYIPWVSNAYPDGWGNNVLGVQVQKYAAGQISWDSMLKNVEQQWEQTRSIKN